MRGDIYYVRLVPRSGAEHTGTRPCIVVSTDAFNLAKGWRSISVIPLTTSDRWMRPSPTTVVLGPGESGLSKGSAALAHQVTTIDRSQLLGPSIGTLTQERMAEVEHALRNYLSV